MSDEQRIYLRNLHGCESRVNLSDGRKIELKPRGQRGDMESVTAEEYKDQRVQDNIGLVYEPLSEESAQEVMEKQNTNRNEPHAPFAAMTNELGEQYHQTEVPVEKAFEEQGEVVGKIETQPSLKNQEVRETIVREADVQESQLGPEKVQVPGSVSEDSHFADQQAKEDPAVMLNELRANSEITEPTKE